MNDKTKIDPRDLTIGSWLIGPDGEPFEFYYSWFCQKTGRWIIRVNNEDEDNFALEHCDPIPLTEDVLKACGFVFDLTSWDYGNVELTRFGDNIGYHEKGLSLNGLGHEIVFLHDLQNFFRFVENRSLSIDHAALKQAIKTTGA